MREVSPNTVLLVDDDANVRKLFSVYLQKAGFKALHAENGIDAIVRLRDTIPKVIATDVEMPHMSGLEFMSVVRRRFPPIPIVGVSEAIPSEVLAEPKPDVWFCKGALNPSELVVTFKYLARKVPDRIDLPQVVPVPVRTLVGPAGYFNLTCTDCLPLFRATSIPLIRT